MQDGARAPNPRDVDVAPLTDFGDDADARAQRHLLQLKEDPSPMATLEVLNREQRGGLFRNGCRNKLLIDTSSRSASARNFRCSDSGNRRLNVLMGYSSSTARNSDGKRMRGVKPDAPAKSRTLCVTIASQ